MVDAFKVRHSRNSGKNKLITSQPDFVAPVVGYLVSKGLLFSWSLHVRLTLLPPQIIRRQLVPCLRSRVGGQRKHAGSNREGMASQSTKSSLRRTSLRSGKLSLISVSSRFRYARFKSHGSPDDGRATNPASTQQGMERVCHTSRECFNS